MRIEASRDHPAGSGALWRQAEEEAFLRLSGLVSLRRACRDVHVRPETLRRHIQDGECRGHRVGGRWFVNGQAVRRWAARHPRRAVAAPENDGDGGDASVVPGPAGS